MLNDHHIQKYKTEVVHSRPEVLNLGLITPMGLIWDTHGGNGYLYEIESRSK